MAQALHYKKNFRVSAALELFDTGGPVALSSEASVVACACADDVKIVDIKTGKVCSVLKGDSELITALIWSRDGKFLLSASRSLQICLWNSLSASSVRSWKKSSDAPTSSHKEGNKGGLLQATLIAPGERVMCVTGDQCLLFYESVNGDFKLSKRLIGYNEEIIDLKFVGEDARKTVWHKEWR